MVIRIYNELIITLTPAIIVAINNTIESTQKIIQAKVNPSLFKTKKNAKYIIAEPGS